MWFYIVMGTLFSIYAIDLLWLVLVAMTARSTEVRGNVSSNSRGSIQSPNPAWQGAPCPNPILIIVGKFTRMMEEISISRPVLQELPGNPALPSRPCVCTASS